MVAHSCAVSHLARSALYDRCGSMYVMILNTGICVSSICILVFRFRLPVDQNVRTICVKFDEWLRMIAVPSFIISLGCSILAAVQGSLRDLNESRFAFLAAGVTAAAYFALYLLPGICIGLHCAQGRTTE